MDDEEQLPSPTTTPNDDADTMKSKHNDVISERTISEKHSAQSSQSMPISSSISLRKSDEESFVQPYVTEIDKDFVFSGASHQCSQSSSSTTLLEDVSEASMLVQKSLLLDGQKCGIFGPQTENEMSNFTMPPPRSSEKAQKLFQQIDELLPSPKENSSEVESVARDQSGSMLTLDMVPESALRSIEDMGSSNFFNMQENCSLDTAADFDQTNLRNSLSKKIDMAEENGPSKPVDLEVKLATESKGVHNTSIPSKDATLGGRSENSTVSNSIALPVTEKPSFRITAPEDLLELDDDEYLPSPTTTPNDDADTKKSKCNDAISKTAIAEQPPAYFSQSMPFSSSISFSNADKESFVQPVDTEKDNSFAFSIASNLCTQSKQPSTPTIPIPQLDKPDMQQECTPSPILSFGSQDVNISTVSSTAISFNDPSVITIGEQSGSELPSTPSGGSSASSSRFADSSSQNSTACAFGATKGSLFGTQSKPSRSGTSQMSQDSTSQFGSFTSSPSFGLANSSLGSFGTLTLGSATSGANPFTSSSGPTISSSANYISSFAPASTAIPFGSSSEATTSSIFTAISNSNTSLPTGLSFGSSISGSNMSHFTVCSSSGSSSLTVLGASSSGSSSSSFSFGLNSGSSTLPFTVGSSSGSGSSVIFGVSLGSSSSPFTMGSSSVTGSSSFTCGASSGPSSSPFTVSSTSGSGSPPFTMGSSFGSSSSPSTFGTFSSTAQGASSVIPSTGSNSSSDVATSFSIFGSTCPSISSLFSSMTGSRSSVATSTASPNTGNSLFGFNASTQPIGSSPSFATSFQNSAATICGASIGSSSSSSSFANSSSQNSTVGAFGATKGSPFGTQSTPSGSGTSQVSQDSTSQFGSFTSSHSFGLANSSSGSFGTSPFGSATSGAKPFTSSSEVLFSSSANISSFAPASSTIPFGSSSQATTSSSFTATSNSSTSLVTGVSFGSLTSGSNMSPFTVGSSSGSSSLTFLGASSSGSSSLTFLGASSSGSSSSSFSFGLNSGSSTLPFTVGSSFGSGSSSFTFGASSGSSSSPFTMGSSSGTGSSSFTFGASSGPSSSPFTVGSSSGSGSSPSTMGSSFGSSSSPFTFGSSSGSSTSPFAFNSSSGSVFLNSASPGLAFGAQKPVFGFGSGPPGNDQMNVEDSMIDVTNNAQTPLVPAFGQPANPPTPPGFMFGSPSVHPVASPTFQFGGLQNTSAPQNPSPFQSAGNADFNPGGSFSLGSGGGDKSARKFVKVKRGPRKK